LKLKKNIPNVITCLNLLCGCLGIVLALKDNGHLEYASCLIGLAAVFDFADGLFARLLKVHSALGRQLDSLADMVSFGVLPGFLMYRLIIIAFQNLHQDPSHLQYAAFLIPVFSALRLAKFNIDVRQADLFIGLPTPANSILIASLPFLPAFIAAGPYSPYGLIALTLLMSYLLIAEIPLFALKFKNFSWADNKIRYLFLITSLALLAIFHISCFPLIILLYILLSLI
jgi:CDP-diacylglycerol--serine O-phosphatidyltransferase